MQGMAKEREHNIKVKAHELLRMRDQKHNAERKALMDQAEQGVLAARQDVEQRAGAAITAVREQDQWVYEEQVKIVHERCRTSTTTS